MNKLLISLTAMAAIALSSNAMADSKRFNDRHDQHYTYARVVQVEPIYKTVRIGYSEKQCGQQETPVKHQVNHVAPEQLLLGGLIGGVIGHELGRNHNQELATVTGVVTGAMIGTAIAHNAAAQYYHDGAYRPQTQQHCRIETRYRTEKQFEGYEVTYRYKGERYTTHTRGHPGKLIRISVEPIPEQHHHRH